MGKVLNEESILRKFQNEYNKGKRSTAEIVASFSEVERKIFFEATGLDTPEAFSALEYDSSFWLRPKQKVPTTGDWFITALVAGRGFGKTLTMTEWVRKFVKENPGCRLAIAGRTAGDIRNTMVTGESGILAKSPLEERPEYKKMESMLVWPNGSTAQLLSSEVPDAARGPQYHATLADEFAAWKTTPDASGATLFDNLVLATRLGKNPKMLLATTPKRTKVMKDVMEWSKDPERKVNIVTGSTYENATLSKDYLRNIENQYGDSDLAKQELEGLMLEDAEGIVFTDAMLESASSVDKVPNNLIKIIAVDPTVAGDPKNADECGIMVIGATRESDYRHRTAYVLEDATVTAKPEDWAKVVADTARKWGIRNVVVETNQGGDLLRNIIQSNDNGLIVHNVTATKGKVKRVEPVAIKMQQGKVFFSPKDDFLQLKDQLTFYDPDISGYSPDRMDAFAWGVTALLIDPPKTLRFGTFQAHRAKGSMPRRMNTGRSVRRYGNRSPRR